MKLSFVIPCYRSASTVGDVLDEIRRVMAQHPELDWEIVAINDCSPDNVLDILELEARKDQRLKVIDCAINRGKHAALMAGYAHATGDIVVGVDDDGQCPLDRLWDLIAPLEQGFDMAMARYGTRQERGYKAIGSTVNDWMARLLIGRPKNLKFSNFTARKKWLCDELAKYTNPYPYLEGLTLRITKNIATVPMDERPRAAGRSNFTFKRSLMLWLNGFTAFSVVPLRMASFAGFLFSFSGFIFALVIVVRKLLHPEMSAGYASIMATLLFLGGVILVSLGLLGEYIGRIYICLNKSPQYVVRRTINC